MKKLALGLVISALFSAGIAHAESKVADITPSSMTINGIVRPSDLTCNVVLSKQTVQLSNELADMGKQSDVAVIPDAMVDISVIGGDTCYHDLALNKLAYRFYGTQDNADGNVLANTDTSEGAAQGIGVRLSNSDNHIIAINSGYLPANATQTSLRLSMVKLNNQTATAGSVKSTLTIEVEQL
ncbi:fimbrial protein [Cronobacter dublinensis]|nr:fimbrial protein [Cronobacter dublinensis]